MAVDYKKEGKIAIFTINRPEAMNALNAEVHRELHHAMLDFRDDPNLWVAIITGAGDKAFSAGADIKEFRPGPRGQEVNVYNLADKIWKPFIAAINGYALGGGLELALTCDIRIAAENARFGLPEIKVGVIPAAGGINRLPRFIPRAKAAEILLMGQHIDAQEAYRIGLVNKVVPADKLAEVTYEMAGNIAKLPPLEVRLTKRGLYLGLYGDLPGQLKYELFTLNFLQQTEDFEEATNAFLEKREPIYKGK